MPKVLCFDCGYMFEIAYGTPNPTAQCPKCKGKSDIVIG
jgi:predicted Zn-ribbon and HTH transcriptional regulator